MVVGGHGEEVFIGKSHGPQRFILIVFVIRMIPVEVVLVITVEVNVVAIVALGAIHCVVAAFVRSVGIGQRKDVNVNVVQEVDDTAIGAGAKLVDEAEHEDHSRHLVAVHGGGVEKLRFARLSLVDTDTPEMTMGRSGELAEVEQGADPAIPHGGRLAGKALHHGHILVVGQISIPVIGTLAIPHGDVGPQRRRCLEHRGNPETQ